LVILPHTSSVDRREALPNPSADLAKRLAKLAEQKGIWIASYPKSGNTWVRVFIHNLMREIQGAAEGEQDINALDAYTSWQMTASPYERILGKPVLDASHAEIAKTRLVVQKELAERQPGPFFIKTHNCVGNIEGYPTINMYMTLAAIYIIRNPLDIAISYAHHSGHTIDQIIRHMADTNATSSTKETVVYEFISSWSFHVGSWTTIPTRPVLILRYEDLLRAPERIFANVAAFLRLRPTPAQLDNAIAKSSFKALAEQEARDGFVERPKKAEKFFRQGKSGQWRDVLTPDQIRSIVNSHAPMMQRFGYLPPDCGRAVTGVGDIFTP
jgi:Sulfotransferase domain